MESKIKEVWTEPCCGADCVFVKTIFNDKLKVASFYYYNNENSLKDAKRLVAKLKQIFKVT